MRLCTAVGRCGGGKRSVFVAALTVALAFHGKLIVLLLAFAESFHRGTHMELRIGVYLLRPSIPRGKLILVVVAPAVAAAEGELVKIAEALGPLGACGKLIVTTESAFTVTAHGKLILLKIAALTIGPHRKFIVFLKQALARTSITELRMFLHAARLPGAGAERVFARKLGPPARFRHKIVAHFRLAGVAPVLLTETAKRAPLVLVHLRNGHGRAGYLPHGLAGGKHRQKRYDR